MSQVMSTQGTIYDCLIKDERCMVLVGIVQRYGDAVSLTSPLPGRFRERLSGRRWALAFVDQRLGLSHYQRA
jgi:hypothetical protein